MAPPVSVLVPTHNQIQFTERCLLSLFQWTTPRKRVAASLEILLLDSDSQDGIGQLTRRDPQWDLRVLRCPPTASANLSFAIGFTAATSRRPTRR